VTYRTGSHWHVTIVREPDGAAECPVPDCPVHEAELVAVVTNGDRELAERICALLNADRALADSDGFCNGHTPDVDHARGATEALTEIRRRLNIALALGRPFTEATIRTALAIAAAELGVDEDAPPAHASVPVAAETVHVEGTGHPEPPEPLSGRLRTPLRGLGGGWTLGPETEEDR
jgi:hypothetical protein